MACPLRSGLSVRSGLAPGVEGGPGVIKPRFCAEPTGPGMLVGGGRKRNREVRVGTRVKSRVWIRRLCRMMLLKTACVFIISQGGRGWAEATPRACLAAALWCPLGTAG